ncbi:DASH family cryptochrome [Gracilimonas halophila]|uniref:Cryptochrome DASH n=1 Tax=Gracilimonas halophila TaxID=1834464 RepID=A0ABW5JJD0_9BACT
MKRSLIWFRNDLRIHDNEALINASQADEILPIYIFDPRQFERTSFGFAKTGAFRAQFLIESVQNLKDNLETIGSDLIILKGKPEELIPELIQQHDIDLAFAHKEITRDEIVIENALMEKLDKKLVLFWGSTLYHINDLPFSRNEIPDVFTNFRKKNEKQAKVRKEFEIPSSLQSIDDIEKPNIPSLNDLGLEQAKINKQAVLQFKGGEDEALKRLENYFWEGDHLKNYKFTRNGLIGADYSSKFSPWLANGCLSPRRIYWEVSQYEEKRKKNVSTYWMIFELIWRDYFRFSAWKHGDKIFWPSGIQGKKRDWNHDKDNFQKWAEGKTGIPFIDANMRELNATGYMSNRGRQNVASFLAQNLNTDWRMGAEYFESVLLDYDPCSNYGNWAYNTTVGHDPRNRYFNIINQAKKYDAKGDFVRTWIPELKEVPDEFIHEPHKMNPEQQTLFGVEIGNEYPKPMINLDDSYEEIKARDQK